MGEGSRTGGDVVDSVTRMRKTLMMMRTGVVAMGGWDEGCDSVRVWMDRE